MKETLKLSKSIMLNGKEILLPNDRKNLLFELDRMLSYRSAIAEEIIYKQGLKDGIKLSCG